MPVNGDPLPGRGERPGRLQSAIAAIAALPSVALATRLALGRWPWFPAEGDMAIIELYTRNASRLTQLLGPYSRFGWHHPGPAMFYLLAPGYVAAAGNLAGTLFTAMLFDLLLLAACAILLRQLAGSVGLTAAALVMPLLALTLRANFLGSIWNPNLVILPLLLAILASAGLAVGRGAYAPLAVAAASFAVQTHVGLAVPLAFTGGAVVALRLFPARGHRGAEDTRPRGWALAAVAVGGAMWLPVVIEQLRGDPGNLTSLWRFFVEPREWHPLAESAGIVAVQSGLPLLSPFGAHIGTALAPALHRLASGLGVLQWAAMPGVFVAARRRSRPVAASVAAMAFSAGVAAWLAMCAVADPVVEYLTRWIVVVGALEVVAIALLVVPLNLRRAGSAVVLAASAGLALLVGNDFLAYPPYAVQAQKPVYRRVAETTDALKSGLRRIGATGVRVRIVKDSGWGLAAGVVLGLVQAGIPVSVDHDWAPMFGPQLDPARFDALVEVADPGAPRGDAEVIHADREFAVLLRKTVPGPD